MRYTPEVSVSCVGCFGKDNAYGYVINVYVFPMISFCERLALIEKGNGLITITVVILFSILKVTMFVYRI